MLRTLGLVVLLTSCTTPNPGLGPGPGPGPGDDDDGSGSSDALAMAISSCKAICQLQADLGCATDNCDATCDDKEPFIQSIGCLDLENTRETCILNDDVICVGESHCRSDADRAGDCITAWCATHSDLHCPQPPMP